jgi:hypothetical protein
MKKTYLVSLLTCFILVLSGCNKDESEGCNDEAACNFNSEAEIDDGSCVYASNWYEDENSNGFGNPFSTIAACNQPVGYSKFPCELQEFWRDEDQDGLGDLYNPIFSCDSLEGYVSNSADNLDALPQFKQRAVMVYQGSTSCGNCGANGDPTLTNLEATFGEDLIILNTEYSDSISFTSSFSTLFGNEFATYYTPAITTAPYCYFSGVDYSMSDHSFTSSPIQFDDEVSEVLTKTPTLGVSASATLISDIVTIHTSVRFVSGSSQHFVGVYLLEDEVMELQLISGAGSSDISHNNILRASEVSGTGNLDLLSIGGSFSADEIVENTFSIEVPFSVVNKSNLKVAVLVWDGQTAGDITNAIVVPVNF